MEVSMTLTDDLWRDNHHLVTTALANPFVQGIADESLPLASFAFFVAQKTHYFQAVARAYSITAARAADWPTFCLLEAMVARARGEYELVRGLWVGLAPQVEDAANFIDPGPALRRYADFLLATAWRYDPGLTVVALLPWQQIYAFLGQELSRGDLTQHRYAGWIRGSAASEVIALNQERAAWVDAHVAPSALAGEIYRYAMLCQQELFQAAWERGQTVG
jgi:thiaminase/transcriptional activator TenA